MSTRRSDKVRGAAGGVKLRRRSYSMRGQMRPASPCGHRGKTKEKSKGNVSRMKGLMR